MSDNIVRFDKNHRKKQRYKTNTARKIKKRIPVSSIIFVLVFGTALFFAFREMRNSDMSDSPNSIPNTYSQIIVTGKTVNYDNNVAPPEKDDIWVMYQSLSGPDKWVYDMFLDLVENRDKTGYNSSIVISDSTLESLGDGYFWNIFHAMCEDHPEFFFLSLSDSNMESYYYSTAGITTYVYEIRKSTKEEEMQIAAFEEATKVFMNDIDLSASDLDIELQIHDKLLDMVSYDYELYEQHKNDERIHDLGFTAFGALVQDSSGKKNMAVCEGYSMAFEHLLHQAGIPCGTVSGNANQINAINEDQGGHAWNVVCIDKNWYEVDTTWDDFESSRLARQDQALCDAYESDEELKYNVCHYYFNRTTQEMTNMTADESTIFEAPGYMATNLRSDSSHIRYSIVYDNSSRIKVFQNALVPIAK